MRGSLLVALAFSLVVASASPQQAAPAFDDPDALFRGYGLIEGGAPVGVPLGGVGTGRLDFCADGSFRNLTLGPTAELLARHPTAFLEVAAERQPAVRRALVTGGAGGLPGVDRLAYRGLFPRAFLRGTDAALGLVADVEAFAPLVPHDVAASSWPAVGFRITLRETAGQAVRATVALHVPALPEWALPHVVVAEPAPGVEVSSDGEHASAAVDLPANGHAEVFLVLAWQLHEHPAASRGDARAVATAFLAEWRALHAATRRWQALLCESGLPRWYAERLLNDLATLTTNTRLSPEGVLATAEGGAGLGGITGTLDQRRVAHVMTQAFFPALDLSELRVFAARQDKAGRVPHHVGTLAHGPLPADEGFLDWPDLACSFTLQVLKTWLWTGDREAVAALLPHVTAALEWMAAQDRDGDGLPEGGSTFDYAPAPSGFSYTASMALAAWVAGARLAADFGDQRLAALCGPAATRARAALQTRLWNGRWFVDAVDGAASDGAAGSFLSQLAGEWTARAFGAGPILDGALVERAADSLIARHGRASPWIPPLHVAEDGGPGDATWGWLGYTYTDYVSLLLQLERLDEAWAALAGLDRMLVERSGDPFRAGLYYDPATGARLREAYDWYMSAPASWWTLYATAGFGLDVPHGELSLAPTLPTSMRRAALPIFAPTFTAVCRVEDASFGVARTLELEVLETHGAPVVLRTLATRAPPTAASLQLDVTVEHDGRRVPARVARTGRDLALDIVLPIKLERGARLRVVIEEPQSRATGAAIEQALRDRTLHLDGERLRVELQLRDRGLARATLRDGAGREARLDVSDLFQIFAVSPDGAKVDVRTDPSATRKVRVAEAAATRDGDGPAAPIRLRHVLELRERVTDTDFERLEVEVEVALVPDEPATRWRLRARGPSLAAARTLNVCFPRLSLVDPGTVGEPLVARLSGAPDIEHADPVRTLAADTGWVDGATPLWIAVRGPRGTLELRSEASAVSHALTAKGDGHGAIDLALLGTVERPPADDEWSRGWDATAEGRVALR